MTMRTPLPPPVERDTRPTLPWAGPVTAIVYTVLIAANTLVATSSRWYIRSPRGAELVSEISTVVLAVLVLVFGLIGRRTVGGVIGAVLILVSGFGSGELGVRYADLRDHLSEHTVERIDDVVAVFVIVLTALGWSLARRRGGAWVLGLVPAVVISVLSVVVSHRLFHQLDGTVFDLHKVRRVVLEQNVVYLVALWLSVLSCLGAERLFRRR